MLDSVSYVAFGAGNSYNEGHIHVATGVIYLPKTLFYIRFTLKGKLAQKLREIIRKHDSNATNRRRLQTFFKELGYDVKVWAQPIQAAFSHGQEDGVKTHQKELKKLLGVKES